MVVQKSKCIRNTLLKAGPFLVLTFALSLFYTATGAHAQLSYDAGLMNHFEKFDPGFDQAGNRRWTFSGTATALYADATGPLVDTGIGRMTVPNGNFGQFSND